MKRIIMASITAVVVIAVLAGTLIPILDDATATTDPFSNVDGSYGYMAELNGDGDDYTFVWDPTNPTVATVNDVEVPLFSGTVVCSVGEMVLRWGTSTTSAYYLQSIPNTFLASVGATTATDSVTITAIDGVLSATYDGTTNTLDYTHGFMICSEGDYVMKKSSQSVYLNGDSVVYATGVTSMGGVWNNALYITGCIDDGYTVTQFYPDPATYTFSDPEDDAAEVNDYTGLYTMSKIEFVATQIEDTTVTKNVTYNYFIVPAEIDGERAVHFTDGENAIFNAIPVMIIIALLLGVVALVLRSRMD